MWPLSKSEATADRRSGDDRADVAAASAAHKLVREAPADGASLSLEPMMMPDIHLHIAARVRRPPSRAPSPSPSEDGLLNCAGIARF